MITDRIELHSVLLPLPIFNKRQIDELCRQKTTGVLLKNELSFGILKRAQTRIFLNGKKNLYHRIKLMLFQIVFVDL